MIARAVSRGEWRVTANGYGVSFVGSEKILKPVTGDGRTIL